jgi:chemotaxis protein methyltransferase CheR
MVQRYGYDFRDYAMASLKRRVHLAMQKEQGTHTISGYQDRILHDPEAMMRFLDVVSVDVTAMFREPAFYKAFRDKVVPTLRELPLIRVWHAGCATGEEAYSMAIVLHEDGLLEKARLYATDINQRLLEQGKGRIFASKQMKDYTASYQKAGGKSDLSDYYTARHNEVILRAFLGKNIVWAEHNLVSDSSFNEFHVVLCRNVMIYFNRKLQDRVHRLIYDSLPVGGVLGLGHGESLRFTPCENCYEVVDRAAKLFRKIR